jgi:hypothetical protein
MATGAAWLKAGTHRIEKKKKNILTRRKKKNVLDTHRPSHGRTWLLQSGMETASRNRFIG